MKYLYLFGFKSFCFCAFLSYYKMLNFLAFSDNVLNIKRLKNSKNVYIIVPDIQLFVYRGRFCNINSISHILQIQFLLFLPVYKYTPLLFDLHLRNRNTYQYPLYYHIHHRSLYGRNCNHL